MKLYFRFLLAIISISLLCSCESDIETKGRTIVVSVASDYTDTNATTLNNPPNDQAALIGQIAALAKGDVEIHTFRVENGNRYYFPPEIAENAFVFGEVKAAPIGNNKSTKRIQLKEEMKDKKDIKEDWNLNNVLKFIQKLDAGKDDLIIFHYSGHGDTDGSLVTVVDENYTLVDKVGTNNIIQTLSAYNPEAVKVMLIDACYSGNYIKDGVLASADKIEIEDRKEIYTGTSIKDTLEGSLSIAFGKDSYGTPNLYVLAAASKNQEAADYLDNGERNQEYYGAFSFYLLRALGFDTAGTKPVESTKEITLYSLYEDIWNSFPSSKKEEQTPRVTLSPIDVVLF